ncbi:hypothetical protein JCM9279_002498 [Rhodotorula babjevae]
METVFETCYYLDHRPTVVLTGFPPSEPLKHPFIEKWARHYNALCVQRAQVGAEGEVSLARSIFIFATNAEAVAAWSGLWQIQMREGMVVRSYLGRPLYHHLPGESMSVPLSPDERSWYQPSLDPHTLTTLAPRRVLDADAKHLAEWQKNRPFTTARAPTRQPLPQPANSSTTTAHVPPAPTAAAAPPPLAASSSYSAVRTSDSGWGARAAQGGSALASSSSSVGRVGQGPAAATAGPPGSAWRPAFTSAPTSSAARSDLSAIPIYRGVTAYERYTPDVKPRAFTVGHLTPAEWLLKDDEVRQKVEIWFAEVVTRIVEMHVWLAMEGYWLIRVVFDSEQMRSVVPISAVYMRAEGLHTKPKRY